MSKITETKINRFDTGMTTDLRNTSKHMSVRHFEVFKDRLVPQDNTIAVTTPTNADIKSFVNAPWITNTKRLFGLGQVTVGNGPKIFQKDGPIVTSNWVALTNAEATSAGLAGNSFISYKNHLYGTRGGTHIWRFGDLTGAPTFSESFFPVTYTIEGAIALVHPSDDSLYFFLDNKIYRNDTVPVTSFTLVRTLPSDCTITSVAAYGNYLAIGCTSNLSGLSTVFLWDRDASVVTFSDKITWGEGTLKYITVLDGRLVGVSIEVIDGLVIKILSGTTAIKVNSIKSTTSAGSISSSPVLSFYTNGTNLYFPISVSLNNDERNGIWAVDSSGNINIEIVEEAVTGAGKFNGIFRDDGVWWISHESTPVIRRTDENSSSSYTSIWETSILNQGTPDIDKKLLAVNVTFEKQPSAGSVKLFYKYPTDTVWVLLKTEGTTNSTSLWYTAISGDITSPTLPEIQFRIESTGGTVITGLSFKTEEVKTNPY